MILMGSRYFFEGYKDFQSHDIDKIQIEDTNEYDYIRVLRGQGKDYFYIKRKPKEEMIKDALKQELPMVVGKFLIPQFNKAIDFTIEDLPRLKPLIDKLDDKHLYEKIIYESYLENNSFTLTDEQRLKAYNEYKKYREQYL